MTANDDPITIGRETALDLLEVLTTVEESGYEIEPRAVRRLIVELTRLTTPPPKRCARCGVVLADDWWDQTEGVCLPCFQAREAELDRKHGVDERWPQRDAAY